LLIGERNSLPVTGQHFDFWKAQYPELVRTLSARKQAIIAAELIEAIRAATPKKTETPDEDEDAADRVRAALGVRRR
jgi:triosephosphate isomerase